MPILRFPLSTVPREMSDVKSQTKLLSEEYDAIISDIDGQLSSGDELPSSYLKMLEFKRNFSLARTERVETLNEHANLASDVPTYEKRFSLVIRGFEALGLPEQNIEKFPFVFYSDYIDALDLCTSILIITNYDGYQRTNNDSTLKYPQFFYDVNKFIGGNPSGTTAVDKVGILGVMLKGIALRFNLAAKEIGEGKKHLDELQSKIAALEEDLDDFPRKVFRLVGRLKKLHEVNHTFSGYANFGLNQYVDLYLHQMREAYKGLVKQINKKSTTGHEPFEVDLLDDAISGVKDDVKDILKTMAEQSKKHMLPRQEVNQSFSAAKRQAVAASSAADAGLFSSSATPAVAAAAVQRPKRKLKNAPPKNTIFTLGFTKYDQDGLSVGSLCLMLLSELNEQVFQNNNPEVDVPRLFGIFDEKILPRISGNEAFSSLDLPGLKALIKNIEVQLKVSKSANAEYKALFTTVLDKMKGFVESQNVLQSSYVP